MSTRKEIYHLEEVVEVSIENTRKLISVKDDLKDLVSLLELGIVDRELKIRELAKILDLTTQAIYAWNNDKIKSGVRLSYVYSYLRDTDEVLADNLNRYIKIEIRKKLNMLEVNEAHRYMRLYKKTGS